MLPVVGLAIVALLGSEFQTVIVAVIKEWAAFQPVK